MQESCWTHFDNVLFIAKPITMKKRISNQNPVCNEVVKIWVSGILLSLVCLFSFSNISVAQGTWTSLANFAPDYNSGVMLLMTDGTVLVKTSTGSSYGNTWDKLTPDSKGSYINGTWSTIAPMYDDRLYFSSQVLRDGRVYVAGGEYGSGGYSGEVYDPQTDTWTSTPLTGYYIGDAESKMLPDGKVLQAIVNTTGGEIYTEIWDT